MPLPNTTGPPWTDPPTPPLTATSNVALRSGSIGLGVAGVGALLLGSTGLGVVLSAVGILLNVADLVMGLRSSTIAAKARAAAAGSIDARQQ